MNQHVRSSTLTAVVATAACLLILTNAASVWLLADARQSVAEVGRSAEELKELVRSEARDRQLADAGLSAGVKAANESAGQANDHAKRLASAVDAVSAAQRSTEGELANFAQAMRSSIERADATAASIAVLRTDVSAADAAMTASLRAVESKAASLAAQSQSLAAAVTSMETRMQGLDGSVKQALGKVYITETPDEVAAAVDAAVKAWLPSTQWTQPPGDSDALRAILDTIRSQTPVGAGGELAGPMRRLEWWADVLELGEVEVDSVARLPSLVERTRQLEAEAPFLVPAWSFEKLQTQRRKAALRATELACNAALESESEVDEARALLSLTERMFGADTAERRTLNALASKIDACFPPPKEPTTLERIETIGAQRMVASKVSDPELRVQLLYGFDAQASALLAECASDQERARAEGLVSAMRKATAGINKTLQDKVSLAYQSWSLQWIKAAENQIDTASGYVSTDEPAIARALWFNLGDIDEQILEPAVRTEFNRVWTKGWSKLGAASRQEVLKWLSEHPKKRLGEVGL